MNPETHLKTASVVANLLDNKFKIGKFGFGLNSLLDLIPGLGDIVAFILSLYIYWVSMQLGLPLNKTRRILFNIVFTFVIGLIPVVGDIGYIFYKANLRNLKIIHDYMGVAVEGKIVK